MKIQPGDKVITKNHGQCLSVGKCELKEVMFISKNLNHSHFAIM